MSIDLEGLSAKQLEAVIARAKKRKEALSKRKPIAAVRKKLVAIAKADGYTIAELFGDDARVSNDAAPTAKRAARKSTRGRTLGKVAPKYRNPENPKETWTGRGKQPRWLAAYTAKGRDLGEFVIPGAAKPTPAKVRPATKKRVVKKAKK